MPSHACSSLDGQRITAIATLNDHMVQLQRQALEATVLAARPQALQQRQPNVQSQPSASHSPHFRTHNGNLPTIPSDPSPSLAEGPGSRRRISNSSDSTSSLRAPRRRSNIRDRGELSGALPSPPISYLRTPSPSQHGTVNGEAGPSALQKRKRPEISSPSDSNIGLQDHHVDDPKRQRFVATTATSSLSPYPSNAPDPSPSTREPISPSSSPGSPKPYHPTTRSRPSPPVHSRSVSRSPSSEKRSSGSDSPPIAKRASRMDITSMLLGGSAPSAADVRRMPVQLEWSSERSTTRTTVV